MIVQLDYEWLMKRAERLLIHCKSVSTFNFMLEFWLKNAYCTTANHLNFFFNEDDYATLTNGAELLIHPNSPTLPKGSTLILPEMSKFQEREILDKAFKVVTDFPYDWMEKTQ